jgi:hypothetical protein
MLHIVIVIIAFVLLIISAALSARYEVEYIKEKFIDEAAAASVVKPLCLSTENCDWARDQLSALINRERDYIVHVGAPSDKEDDGPFGKAVRSNVIDASIWNMRALLKDKWIIFFDKPDYKGKIYLLEKKDMSWEAERPGQDGQLQKNIHLNSFIQRFTFYYGRKFSVMIPAGFQIAFRPVPSTTYPNETIQLAAGDHNNVEYFKGTLKEFHLIRV